MKPPKIPEPPGAYGPTQYPFIGMNCSFCAEAVIATPASARPQRAALTAFIAILLENVLSRSGSSPTTARLSIMDLVSHQHRHPHDNSAIIAMHHQCGNGHSRSF